MAKTPHRFILLIFAWSFDGPSTGTHIWTNRYGHSFNCGEVDSGSMLVANTCNQSMAMLRVWAALHYQQRQQILFFVNILAECLFIFILLQSAVKHRNSSRYEELLHDRIERDKQKKRTVDTLCSANTSHHIIFITCCWCVCYVESTNSHPMSVGDACNTYFNGIEDVIWPVY